ncbi:YitT family protein [uncultured Eubacterium sp.]|uniref:YitT family protein n=1 Tax=uncultured Eubacterium sp. TaxID=165185 RepID=UPI0026737A2E|nr:YitT family protein [uncultured Eubacterium sp.]
MSGEKREKYVSLGARIFGITMASLLYAVGVGVFLNPNNLAPGGVSGIAIILKKIFPVLPGVGMLILIINIPIMIVGWKKFGLRFIISTSYALVISSLFIDIIPKMIDVDSVSDNPMLSSIIGGAAFGLAMGLLFRMETTTGGMDIIVKIVRGKYPHLKTGQIYLLLDIVILIASAFAFSNVEVALYAAIAIYVSTLVMDKAIYIGDEATLIYIMSKKRKQIADYMMKELDVGVTFIKSKGAYSNTDGEIIMCVMRKQRLAKVRTALKETDPEAFMIVTSANEVFGEGFKSHFKADI